MFHPEIPFAIHFCFRREGHIGVGESRIANRPDPRGLSALPSNARSPPRKLLPENGPATCVAYAGGRVTVPTFGIYDREGNWILEGHGVEPDIEVIDDPAAMARGADPQLERAVVEIMKALDDKPRVIPKKPVYPDRAGGKFTE